MSKRKISNDSSLETIQRLPVVDAPKCKVTQQQLLQHGKGSLTIVDPCPLCANHGVFCEVGMHQSEAVPSLPVGMYLTFILNSII